MIHIKPLSVNRAWQGKRFKTPIYKKYEHALMVLLPRLNVPSTKLAIDITFGFSNKGSDIDNPLKPFLDILQKKYNFNDSHVYELNVRKVIVEKGLDFIDFNIKEL
jgi:Holliday junction resolvase RusA-like endonuclease